MSVPRLPRMWTVAMTLALGVTGACANDTTAPGVTGDATGDTRTSDATATTATNVGDATETEGGPLIRDDDQDGVPDNVDNCLGLFNPFQGDSDHDGVGDQCEEVTSAPDDADGDGIPDLADPFPSDPLRPGMVQAFTVYAHTSTELFYISIKHFEVIKVGNFKFPSGTSDKQMTDIAIDRYGVMYGIGYDAVYVIHPTTAECWKLGSLPQSFNGLTLVPREILGTPNDMLVGMSLAGGWWKITLIPATATAAARVEVTYVGDYGQGYGSSGDAFSIEGIGTFASVDTDSNDTDFLAEIDPVTGAVKGTPTSLAGFTQVWGLAGWRGKVYAFDASGKVAVFDLQTHQILDQATTNHPWWGAGVRTVLDVEPATP